MDESRFSGAMKTRHSLRISRIFPAARHTEAHKDNHWTMTKKASNCGSILRGNSATRFHNPRADG